MTPRCLHRFSWVAPCAIAGLLLSATTARAQTDFGTPSQAETLALAVKSSPELVQGLAKELGATPEQAAGTAGALFGIAKSLLKPDDFAAMSKVVPGMDALLAAMPPGIVGASKPTLTPGFASSTSTTMAAPDGMASAFPALSKIGIKPEMIAKAIPYMAGYLKKYGGDAIGALLGGVLKTGK